LPWASITYQPAVLDLACFCRVGLHVPSCEKLRILPKKRRDSRELRRIHQRRRVEENKPHSEYIMQRVDVAMQYPPLKPLKNKGL